MESHAQSIQRLDMTDNDKQYILTKLEAHQESIQDVCLATAAALEETATVIEKMQQEIELIKRTLRPVCIDTENPIHF